MLKIREENLKPLLHTKGKHNKIPSSSRKLITNSLLFSFLLNDILYLLLEKDCKFSLWHYSSSSKAFLIYLLAKGT